MKYPENIKKDVIAAYENSDMTVKQIAEKYNICVRAVYAWTQKNRTVRRQLDYSRKNFRFTDRETDVLIFALFYYSGITSGSTKAIVESLRDRLINKTE